MNRFAFQSDEENPGGRAHGGRTTDRRTAQSLDGYSSDALCTLTRKNVEIIAQLEQAANAQPSWADKTADTISRFVGSMMFVYLHVAWFGIWIAPRELSPNRLMATSANKPRYSERGRGGQ
jgi:hypothetical protein